jgi:PAS domain S-box-containing protein
VEFQLSDADATIPLSCDKCRSTDVSAMSVTPQVIYWWCATCGSIWGVPMQPMPDTFDAEVQQLRAGLQGIATRLDRVVSRLERIPASVLIVDDNGRYVAVNDEACALTGYSRAELLRKAIIDLMPPHARQTYERVWDSFVHSPKQHGFCQIRRKDGSVVNVKYCAYVNLAPGIHISFITAS